MQNDSPTLRRLLSNPVFANILMLCLLGGGVFGILRMVREGFPDFDLDIITVTVPYPGADPAEVEEGICRPLEDALEGLSDVKRVYTLALEGSGRAIIEVEDGGDLQAVKDEVDTKVGAIITFPEDAERPIVTDVRFDHEVVSLILWGDLPERQLKELGRQVKDDLTAMDGISRVDVAGVRDYQVSIEVSETKLRQYNLSFQEVARLVAQSSFNLPAGSVQTLDEELKLRVLGRRYRAPEFRDIVIVSRPDGVIRRLGDIADIRDTFDPDIDAHALFNGKPAVRVRVLKSEAEDSIEISGIVREYSAAKRESLPSSCRLTAFFDESRLIQDRIDLLVRNGAIGLLLVFFCLWLFLDLRMSFWVTAGIPISLAGALMLMYFFDQSLNMISLFGLIMVLGIIVDDAIVVGEAIYAHREAGEKPHDAAVAGVREVFWSVVAAVLTTIVAFLPLFFIAGIMGKFIGVLPMPVVAALFVSLFEALLILPVHLRHLPPPGKKAGPGKRIPALPGHLRRLAARGLTTFGDRIYGPLLDRLLRWRYVTIAAALLILLMTAGLIAGGLLKFRFFPEADGDFLQTTVEMPNGAPIEETERAVRQVLEAWNQTAAEFEPQLQAYEPGPIIRLQNRLAGQTPFRATASNELAVGVFALIGGTFGDFGETSTANHLGTVLVELKPAEQRHIQYRKIQDRWRRHIGGVTGAESVKVQRLGGGPPGDNIEIDLLGRDLDRLLKAQARVREELATYEGVYQIDSSHEAGKQELRVTLKDSARPSGITLQDIAAKLRSGFYGNEVMRVQRGTDEVKIMVRYPAAERQSEAVLRRLRIRTPSGQEIPLDDLVEIEKTPGYALIRREEGQRVVRLTAEVGKNVNSDEIMTQLLTGLGPELASHYGVTIRRGPRADDRKQSVQSIRTGFIFAVAMIFLIMATIFKSYLQPAVIMLTIPFGLLGAVFGHLIYGATMGPMPLSIMSFFGMVALTGVVVNDSIVLIVAVNDRVAEDMTFFDALREGGKRRFRAIVLTSLTTCAGLFPMILERSFQAQVLIPMAISLAFGIVFASLSTLILIPCLMAALNDLRRLWFLGVHGFWPSRDQVERNLNGEQADA